MKKIILFLFLFSTFNFLVQRTIGLWPKLSTSVYAANPSLTPTPTKEANKPTNTDIINDLKDRIASRVAELKLVEKRGLIGIVTDVSDTQISISDLQNNTRFIDVDELTKFSSPSAKGSFGISDVTKGSKIGVLGLYNKQSRRTLARFVDVLSLPKSVNGVISSKDEENFTLTVASENSRKTTVDIEKVTKTFSYTKEGGLIKSGFSKIKGNEHVIIVGFQDIKDKNKIIASRILVFPEIPKDPRIIIADPALSSNEDVIPSTGSGKKLTPITR